MVNNARLNQIFWLFVALAALWVFLPWYPRMVGTFEIAVISLLFIPVAFLMKRGNYLAYRILRAATWLMWIFMGCYTIFILVLTKGHLSELNFGDDPILPQEVQALGRAVVRGAGTFILAFVLNTICYFLLISKSVVTFFRDRKHTDGEQLAPADASSRPR